MLELIKIGTDFATGKPVFEILGATLKSHTAEEHLAVQRCTPDYFVFDPESLYNEACIGEIEGAPVYDLNGLYGVITGNLWASGLASDFDDPESFCNEVGTAIIQEKYMTETRPFYIVELD
jgi:hypothetical protein